MNNRYVKEGSHKFRVLCPAYIDIVGHNAREQGEHCIYCSMRLSYWNKIPQESKAKWQCKG